MRFLGVIGDPGAAAPAGATIVLYNLDDQNPPVSGLIEENGSFNIPMAVDPGNELRFHIMGDGFRSDPFDVIAGLSGTNPAPVERVFDDCVLLEPAAQVFLADGDTVEVDNVCDHDVELAPPRLRRPLTGIELGVAGRSYPVMQPGESVTYDVHVQSDWDIEEIFFITVMSPEHDRRPITFVPP
jgi:hypothetical protein